MKKYILVILALFCFLNYAFADTVIFKDGRIMKGNIVEVNEEAENFKLDVVMEGELIGAKIVISGNAVETVILSDTYRNLEKPKLSKEEIERNRQQAIERKKQGSIVSRSLVQKRRAKERAIAKRNDERDWQRELIKRQQQHELSVIEHSRKFGTSANVRVNVGDEPVINIKNTGKESSNTNSGNTENLLLQTGQ